MRYLHSVRPCSPTPIVSQKNSSHIAKGTNVDRTWKGPPLFDPAFAVAIAIATELVPGFRLNMSELFATLIAGRPEVLEVCRDDVVLALFDGLVTKENEIPVNMEAIVGRNVLRGDEVRVEIVVGFVMVTLETDGFDIVPTTSGALDMAGKVTVNVLIALMVMMFSMVM
jgi:hypothetical protein